MGMGDETHRDLQFWKWLVKFDNGSGQLLKVHVGNVVKRRPDRIWTSDASYEAIGGFCSTTGVWWRYDLNAEQALKLNKSKKAIDGDGSIHINLLELLGMIMTAWVMVVVERQRPDVPGETALLRGDNTSAVHWVNSGGVGMRRDPRAGGLLRLLGSIELSGGWGFDAMHVKGTNNYLADGISRWPYAMVQRRLEQAAPQITWRQSLLRPQELNIIICALRGNWPDKVWEWDLWDNIAQACDSGNSGDTR